MIKDSWSQICPRPTLESTLLTAADVNHSRPLTAAERARRPDTNVARGNRGIDANMQHHVQG